MLTVLGLRLLKCLSLIVAANCHRERKSDNQRNKGQGCSRYDVEIVPLALFEGMRALAKEIPTIGRNNLRAECNRNSAATVPASAGFCLRFSSRRPLPSSS